MSAMMPQPSTIPISDTFGGDVGHRIEGITDHHIPEGFGKYRCVVHEIDLDMVSFQTMKMRIAFTIEGEGDSLSSLYSEEQWKFFRTDSVMKKHSDAARRLKAPAPIFALLLNKYLQVVRASLRMLEHGREAPPILFDQSGELILLPDSYPPLAGLPEGEHYSYYDKKAAVFYSDVVLNTRYEVEIELESNAAMFEFAPVFPYGRVTLERFSERSSGDYNFTAAGSKVQPTRSGQFPQWYSESLAHKQRLEPRRQRPTFYPASPFRGEVPLFDVLAEASLPARLIVGRTRSRRTNQY